MRPIPCRKTDARSATSVGSTADRSGRSLVVCGDPPVGPDSASERMSGARCGVQAARSPFPQRDRRFGRAGRGLRPGSRSRSVGIRFLGTERIRMTAAACFVRFGKHDATSQEGVVRRRPCDTRFFCGTVRRVAGAAEFRADGPGAAVPAFGDPSGSRIAGRSSDGSRMRAAAACGVLPALSELFPPASFVFR